MDLTLKAGTEDQNYSHNIKALLLFFSIVFDIDCDVVKPTVNKLLVPLHSQMVKLSVEILLISSSTQSLHYC